MADNRTTVELDLETRRAVRQLGRFTDTAVREGNRVGTRLETAILRGPIRALGVLQTRFLAVGGALGAFFAGRAIIQAAERQEDAVNQLNTALATAGRFSTEASNQFQMFASELQQVTRIGDETTLEMLGLASAFARTNQEAQDLVSAAVDVSAATGITLESAVRNLGRTFSGLTGELGEAVPQVRELTAEQLRAGEAIRVITERFGGSAQAQIRTFAGATAQLSNAFGDFLEQLGFVLTRSPVLVGLINRLSAEFARLSSSLERARGTQDVFARITREAINFGIALNQSVIAPLEVLFNVTRVVFNGILAGFQAVIAGVANVASRIVNLVAPGSDLARNLSLFGEASTEVFMQFSEDARQSITDVFNVDFSQGAEQLLLRFQETVNSINLELDEINIPTDKIIDQANRVSLDVGEVFRNLATQVIARSVSTIGAALVRGGDAFANFGGAILGILGDIATQTGTTLLLSGLGIEALRASIVGLAGGPAIAAGIALIALGGLLKALSGGGGTEQSGAAPGAAVSSPTAGVADDPQFDAGVEAEEGLEPQSQITVNVQGNILDRRETGVELLEGLLEASQGNGLRLEGVGNIA